MEFFDNLIIKDKESEISINEEPRDEGSPQIFETQPENYSRIVETKLEFRISKKV